MKPKVLRVEQVNHQLVLNIRLNLPAMIVEPMPPQQAQEIRVFEELLPKGVERVRVSDQWRVHDSSYNKKSQRDHSIKRDETCKKK